MKQLQRSSFWAEFSERNLISGFSERNKAHLGEKIDISVYVALIISLLHMVLALPKIVCTCLKNVKLCEEHRKPFVGKLFFRVWLKINNQEYTL